MKINLNPEVIFEIAIGLVFLIIVIIFFSN